MCRKLATHDKSVASSYCEGMGTEQARRNWFVSSLVFSCLAVAGCGGGSSGGTATPIPAPTPPPAAVAVKTQAVFAGLTFAQPVAAMQAPGDPARWFVVERTGNIWVFDNDPLVSSRQLFADVSSRLFTGAPEAGLLGMAFHPDYATNHEVFLSYTRSGAPLESVVSRFVSDGVSLDLGTEQVVMTVLQDFTNHNGGHITFGPDGFLYIGMGDGGSSNDPNDRAQTQSTLLGKLLRIDVDGAMPYASPPGNPFAGNGRCVQGFGGAPCPEIFASGLRNPWRFSFDRVNGELWLGDVGQGRFEEINRVEVGMNFGWRIREGSSCQTPPSGCTEQGLTDPIHDYGRALGTSVTGGFVYRGADIAALQARYIFGDFGSGRIFALPLAPVIGSDAEELIDTALSISSFAQSNDGELYVLDYGGGGIHQLVEDTP